MVYSLDLTGHDVDGNPGVCRFGGSFTLVKDAVDHGTDAAAKGRFVFRPETVWVRDQAGEVVYREVL